MEQVSESLEEDVSPEDVVLNHSDEEENKEVANGLGIR